VPLSGCRATGALQRLQKEPYKPIKENSKPYQRDLYLPKRGLLTPAALRQPRDGSLLVNLGHLVWRWRRDVPQVSLRFIVYGLWFTVYRLWFMVYGLSFMVYGLRFIVYGLWFTV